MVLLCCSYKQAQSWRQPKCTRQAGAGGHAPLVMALYRSCPAVSQIWALIVLPSTCRGPASQPAAHTAVPPGYAQLPCSFPPACLPLSHTYHTSRLAGHCQKQTVKSWKVCCSARVCLLPQAGLCVPLHLRCGWPPASGFASWPPGTGSRRASQGSSTRAPPTAGKYSCSATHPRQPNACHPPTQCDYRHTANHPGA